MHSFVQHFHLLFFPKCTHVATFGHVTGNLYLEFKPFDAILVEEYCKWFGSDDIMNCVHYTASEL